MKRIVTALFCLLLHFPNFFLSLQPLVFASGGGFAFLSDSAFCLSYTVGESVIESLILPSGSLTQGFQQPDKVVKITQVETLSPAEWGLSVYPNPVHNNLMLDISAYRGRDLTAMVWNAAGQVVIMPIGLNNQLTTLDISFLPAGYYLIRFADQALQQAYTLAFIKAGF